MNQCNCKKCAKRRPENPDIIKFTRMAHVLIARKAGMTFKEIGEEIGVGAARAQAIHTMARIRIINNSHHE
jgi:hypothetical protein